MRPRSNARLIASVSVVCLLLAALPALAVGDDALTVGDDAAVVVVETKPLGQMYLGEDDYARLLEATKSAPSAATWEKAELEAFASSIGLGTDMAVEVLDFQKSMAPVVEKVAASFPRTYGGASYSNEADYGLVFDTAGSEDELLKMARSLAKAVGADPDRISVRSVPLSRADAMAAYPLLYETLSEVDNLVATVRFDVETATYTLSVPSDVAKGERPDLGSVATVDDVRAAVGGFGSRSALSVVVDTTDFVPEDYGLCDPDAAGWMEGGRAFRFNQSRTTYGCDPDPNKPFCTTGFAVTRYGVQGVLTAGHCNGHDDHWSWWSSIMYANEENDFVAMRPHVQAAERNRYADAQMDREVNTAATVRNKVYLYDQIWQNILDFTHEHPLNTYVCMKGAKTAADLSHRDGKMCGIVAHNLFSPNVWNSPYAFAKVDLTFHPWARQGDSGGPVWSPGGGIARGIIVGGNPAIDEVWYNKIAFILGQLDATLVTN